MPEVNSWYLSRKVLDSEGKPSINEGNPRYDEPPVHRKTGLFSVTNTLIIVEN